MTANGTYSFVFCGEVGVGVGILSIQDDKLTGTDSGGGKYRGCVKTKSEEEGFKVVFDLFVPAGLSLVLGTSTQPLSYCKNNIEVDLRADFYNGEPIKVSVPPGEVTLMIRRISDEFAQYASSMKIHISLS